MSAFALRRSDSWPSGHRKARPRSASPGPGSAARSLFVSSQIVRPDVKIFWPLHVSVRRSPPRPRPPSACTNPRRSNTVMFRARVLSSSSIACPIAANVEPGIFATAPSRPNCATLRPRWTSLLLKTLWLRCGASAASHRRDNRSREDLIRPLNTVYTLLLRCVSTRASKAALRRRPTHSRSGIRMTRPLS